MKFSPTWYKNPNLSDVPSFQELEDITGMAYDNEGYYIGPKEKPKMQLVMDQRTNRQYWAPEEYDEDAVKYGAALLDREFNSKEWWGMMNDPLLSMGEKVSVASLELLKQSGKTVAKAPTEIVAGVTGMTDAVGIDAGNLAKSVWANLNPVAYFGSQVARKGIKATAQDYVDLLKNIKTPKGEMGETAALYRASAKNWEATLDKWLPDVDDNIKAHSTLVTVGSMAGQIGGSLVLAAATSYVGGLPAVAGVFGSQQFYNLREEYLSKGYSLQSANIYAGVGAILEGGLEALGFNQWLKYATLKPSLRNHLIAGLKESSQEMLQTGAEAALTNFSGVREETIVEVLAQIAIAGVAGFIPGAGISMVSGGIGIRMEKAQYELDKAIEQAPKPVQPKGERGEYIKGPNAKQELELAKANKGSNPVYEFVRNLAVANGIKGEEQIDALFYFARNQQAQGIVGEELLQGLGKQMVAYNKQLALPDKTADKENKKAAEDITYHLSEEAANKFRENTKAAAEKSGLSREEAERVADSETKIYTHLSQEFGEDVMGVKQVEYVVPSREEAKAPTVDEALAEAQAIDGQIAELKKIEGTQNQIAQLEQEKGKILSRGYIDMSGTINKIVLGNFSDVTTIKHELMHHWQYIIKTLAAKGNKKAQALQKQIDKIIAENKDYVKQDANKEAEVLTEAYELWLHTGVVADSEQQGLFDALKRFFQSVYSSAKDITGIRMNGEIDYLFRQMTGLAPIDMRGEENASNPNQQNSNDVMFQEGDSIFNRTDKRKYMTDNEVKAANEDYQAFKEKFASLQDGKMPSADSFTLSRSLPSAYNKIPELKGKRMVMSQSVFKKIINLKNKYGKNHNLDYKRAEKLPLYIADPLYITRSKAEGHEDRFVIITASRGVGDGVRLSVAVQPGKNVVVVSAYDEVVNISEEKKSNRLVYSKKDELLKTNATSKAAPISNSNKSIANQTGIVKTQNTLFQSGFHGSPHRFATFDLSKVGTGEGAQAHGYGVYVAKQKETGINYRTIRNSGEIFYKGRPINELMSRLVRTEQYDRAALVEDFMLKMDHEALDKDYYSAEDLKWFEEEILPDVKQEGSLFEVEIPENDVLLEEDKNFNEQTEFVKRAVKKEISELKEVNEMLSELNEGENPVFSALQWWADKNTDADARAFYEVLSEALGSDKNASEYLNRIGIKGIRYFGQQDGECFVIFDDKAVQIKKTYYQTIKAQQTGAKAADEKPSKEQIAKDLDIIKRNGVEKYEKKSGFWSQIGETAQGLILSVRQRAGAIDPKLKAFFDKLDYFQPALEKKFADQTKGWFKKYHDLTEEDKNIFDYYIYNQLHEELDIFLKEKNMAKEYQDVRNLLNFIYSISNQAGIDMGFISEYFPTSIIDHEGFMNHMKGTEKWTYIEKSLKEADPQGLWDSKQRAEVVNKLLRGYKLTDPVSKPKNAKERTILYKSPELMKFYEHSDKALMKYLQGMSRAIAINKAYGKGAGFDTDATIGAIVLDLIEGGHITRAEEDTVRHLLKSRLSYSATPEVFGIIKNLGYLSMMNNITSAITQLGDLYAPFYKYSFPTAMEAIFGKKELTRKDLGLDKIWEEFSNEKWHGIAVDKLFKAIGLDMMDAFGKKVSIQASLLNLRKQAEKGDVELLNRLSYTFGTDSAKVLADIKSGKVTEDVKILVFCDLADTQPIGKSGVPTGYLNHPNMRLFYQLKTFMLNQMSLFYADSMVNIQKGIKHKNKAQFLKGVQNGFKLVLLLTAGNATADVLKNLIMGREIDLEDTVVSNLLWNIGISKYTFYKGQREGYGWALFTSYIMPPQIGTADDVQRDAKKMAQGKQELKDSMLWTFLPFGRMYYWWFGGASEEGKKRTKKLTKKVNAKNRKKKKKKDSK